MFADAHKLSNTYVQHTKLCNYLAEDDCGGSPLYVSDILETRDGGGGLWGHKDDKTDHRPVSIKSSGCYIKFR